MGRRASRIFKELPDRGADPNRSGVAVVSVLFGVVLVRIADGTAIAIRALNHHGAPDATPVVPDPGATLAHYGVAFTLVVTSFAGYFASKNGPQLRMKFFNLPFWLIGLDCAMVGSYFVLAQYAEGSSGQVSAAPEVIIVILSFGLYALWDVLGFALQQHAPSQLALGRRVKAADGDLAITRFARSYGWRRWTTLGFLVLLLLAAWVVPLTGWLHAQDAVLIDLLLVGVLFLYRLVKVALDRDVTYSGEQIEGIAYPADVRDEAWYRDCSRLVPAPVWRNIALLADLDCITPRTLTAAAPIITSLEAAGAIIVSPTGAGTVEATLTEAGAAWVDARARANTPP